MTNPNIMPTLHDVMAARPHVYRYLKPTPLHHYPTLSEYIGAHLDDFVLVSEAGIKQAIRLLLHHTHNLAGQPTMAEIDAYLTKIAVFS